MALPADHFATKAEPESKFGELRAEIAELRGRVTALVWVVGLGFAAVIAASAIFRYLG